MSVPQAGRKVGAGGMQKPVRRGGRDGQSLDQNDGRQNAGSNNVVT